MGARTVRHIVGAGIGLAAAPAMAFLLLDGIRSTTFLSHVMPSNHPGGLPEGGGIRLASEWLAGVELLASGVLAGVLAGARRISPVAAGAVSGRWRREPRPVPVAPTPTAGPALEQAPNPELAPQTEPMAVPISS
jgi:hypothetical protein